MIQTLLPAPRRVRRGIHSGIAAVLIAAVVGCGGGDSSTGPRNADPTGLYSLRQVGRDAIPTRIFRGAIGGIPDFTIEVTGGELILQEGDRYSMALDFALSATGGPKLPRTVSFEGDYEIEGGQLTMVDAAGDEAQGTLRNGVITVGLDVVGDGTLKPFTFKYVP